MAAAVLTMSGLAMAGAAPASAATSDQIWYQAVGSPSKDAPCPASDPADLAKGWTPWVKGYEMWPNDGKGGWTCGRSILWAKGSPPPSANYPSAGCIFADVAYYNFRGGWSLPSGTDAHGDSGCTAVVGSNAVPIVYAPAGWDATSLCLEAFGLPEAVGPFGEDVYGCTTS